MKIFEVIRLQEFERELKKLTKRFRTLEEDLDILIKTELVLYHKLGIDNSGIFPIANLGITYPKIFKVTKFTCRSLRGKGVRSGLRLIYAYYEDKDKIELIEIYYHEHGNEIEDRKRIDRYYKKKL